MIPGRGTNTASEPRRGNRLSQFPVIDTGDESTSRQRRWLRITATLYFIFLSRAAEITRYGPRGNPPSDFHEKYPRKKKISREICYEVRCMRRRRDELRSSLSPYNNALWFPIILLESYTHAKDKQTYCNMVYKEQY